MQYLALGRKSNSPQGGSPGFSTLADAEASSMVEQMQIDRPRIERRPSVQSHISIQSEISEVVEAREEARDTVELDDDGLAANGKALNPISRAQASAAKGKERKTRVRAGSMAKNPKKQSPTKEEKRIAQERREEAQQWRDGWEDGGLSDSKVISAMNRANETLHGMIVQLQRKHDHLANANEELSQQIDELKAFMNQKESKSFVFRRSGKGK